MAKYIDAEKIPYFLFVGDDTPIEGIEIAYRYDISRIPMADVIEIKYGHWNNINHYQNRAYGQCSVCGERGQLRTDRDDMGVWYINTQYCPNCGAKMDGRLSEDEERL